MNEASTLALANRVIAITRPTDQANILTQAIQQAGGQTIAFPLIKIAPLQNFSAFHKVISNLQLFDWVIFISSNAVQNAMPSLLSVGIPSHLQFAAIGPSTAQTLQSYGIQKVLMPQSRFDSESLLALSEMQAMQSKRVLIVRGVGGRELLADTLKARGADVVFGECYQRINPQKDCKILEDAFKKHQLHAIVITSSEAMRYLLDLAGHADWLKHTPICVNHARIAEDTHGLQVHIASAPGDAAMLALLNSLF